MRTWSTAVGTLVLFLASTTAYAQSKPPTIWDAAHSSNYTTLNYNRGIQYVVIHTIEGSANGARSWFKNPSSNVSAHYVVSYGGTIWQMVKDKDRAWHAGNSYYNTHSIGIEHEGYAGQNYWTEAMYQKSAALTRWVCLTYNIPMNRTRIIGHNEVPGATHWDPGPHFNWNYYMSLVTNGGGAPPPTSTLKAMKVTAGGLNVRSGPSTGYAIKGVVYNGQRYVSIATSGSWHKIYYKGNTAWCHGGYLSQVTGVTGAKITAAGLNVRTGPSTGYGKVGVAYSGDRYVRITTSGAWWKIYYGGGTYWIHGGYATPFGM